MARGPISAESLGLTGRLAEIYSEGKVEQMSWFSRRRCEGCNRTVHVTYSQRPALTPNPGKSYVRSPELCEDCIIEEVE